MEHQKNYLYITLIQQKNPCKTRDSQTITIGKSTLNNICRLLPTSKALRTVTNSMLLLISRRSEHIREVMKKSVDFHKIKTDSGTLITFLTFLKQHTAEIQKIFGCTRNRFIL